jgi:WD40 repeat protein
MVSRPIFHCTFRESIVMTTKLEAVLLRRVCLVILTMALTLEGSVWLKGQPVTPRPAQQKQAGVDLFGDPLPQGAVARLGTLRWRAGPYVQSLAYTSDGKTLVAMSQFEVCLFDAATGKLTKRIRPSKGFISRAALSPDGKRLVHLCYTIGDEQGDKTIQVRELATGRKTLEVDASELLWLGWSSEGQPLALNKGEGELFLRELTTGKEKRFEAEDLKALLTEETAFAYTARGKLLAVIDVDGHIQVWDAATQKKRYAFEAKAKGAIALVFSPDGRMLAALTTTGVRLWNMAAGKETHSVAADQKDLEAIAFSPDSTMLATISCWQGARLWDLASGRERVRTKDIQRYGKVGTFSPDGKTLAMVMGYGGTIHFWNVATGALRHDPMGHTNKPFQAAFSPDGRKVATGSTNGFLFVWDPATGRRLAQVRREGEVANGHAFSADGHAFSADGRSLYSFRGNMLYFSDATSGKELQVLKVEDPERPNTRQSGIGLYLSDDGKTLVALSRYYPRRAGDAVNEDTLITGWDTATRKQLFRRRQVGQAGWWAVSGDLQLLALEQRVVGYGSVTPAKGPMRVEKLATGEQLLTFPALPGQTWPLAFSPDGRLLASRNSSPDPLGGVPANPEITIRLWEVATATEALSLPITGLAQVAFSSDGRLLAVAPVDQQIILWDLRRRQEHQRFKGFDAEVTGLTFSPDGRRLVSSLGDTTLLVWEVAAVQPSGLAGADLARAWADLGGDARKALAARGTLAMSPEQAVPLLKEHMRPAQPADAGRLQRLIADLNSPRFNERDAARKELEELGDLATAALRRALAGKPTLEARRRIEALLARQREPVTRPETLRALRAVAVLEDIATVEARAVLRAWASGAPGARLTEEASGALDRLARMGK